MDDIAKRLFNYRASDNEVALLLNEARIEIEKLRRARDELLSYLNGISRQTAAMVEANS